MATFPDCLATSYVAGITPVVKAADLMALQVEHVRRNRDLRGRNLLFIDDFLGDQINRTLWTNPPATVTLPNDATLGGAGVVRIDARTQGAGLTAPVFGLGTFDFRLVGAIRLPSYSNGQSLDMSFGFPSLTDPQQRIAFRFLSPSPSRNVLVSNASAADVDTGVAIPVASYSVFELRRSGKTVTCLIDDVVVATVPLLSRLDSASLSLGTAFPSSTAIMLCDYVKLWVERQPVSSATLGQALGAHAESKTAVFNGTQDFVDIVWTIPFANTNYRLPAPGVLVSSGPNVVTASYANKTLTGIRVVPSARFTGEVYVDAHE